MHNLTYRFWGARRPALRASILAGEPVDGVVTFRLYDPIDSWGDEWGVSAKEVAAALDALPENTSEIRLHINSPGGEVFEGVAILNLLRAHRAKVVSVIDGVAASAASFIACGAGEVIMGRNTQLMIHDAWGLCMGNAEDMRDLASKLDKVSDNIASIYAAKAGGSTADWRTPMLTETWYDAAEAVAAGLADSVDPGAAPPTDGVSDRFDLSAFRHQGRRNAPAPSAAKAPSPTFDRVAAEARAQRSHRLRAKPRRG